MHWGVRFHTLSRKGSWNEESKSLWHSFYWLHLEVFFIEENGSLFVSMEYPLNPRKYVKEEFDLIYRLVYYVVKQSHINSPRTIPVSSSVSVNE